MSRIKKLQDVQAQNEMNAEELQDVQAQNEMNAEELQDVQEIPHISEIFSMEFRTDDPNILVGIRQDIQPGKLVTFPIVK